MLPRISCGVGLLALCLASFGCGRSAKSVSYVDAGVEALAPVGWLGARVQPLTRDLTITLDDEEHVPGGVIVRALDPGAPLESAGAQIGDVLVRVDDSWLPLKRDMHLDLVRLVEQRVSAGKTTIALGAWRGGTLTTLSLRAERKPLETGLPVDVIRFNEGAAQALATLAPGDASTATWALAGLAMLASGTPHANRLGNAQAKVRAGLEAEDATTADLAWGLLFEAEQIGALPAAYVLAAAASSAPAAGRGPPKMPGGAGGMPVHMTPDQLKALMEQLGASGATVRVGGSPPPGVELPTDEQPGPPPDKKSPAKPTPKAGELLERLDPERVPKLARLEPIVARLATRQTEDGGWAAATDGEPDAETTSLVLWSLGSLARAGGPLPGEPIEKGIRFLRENLHEGRLSIEVAKGADRRVEAGRAALAALALRALGCPDDDEMLQALWKFSDGFGSEILDASGQQTTYLIATGVGRRSRGLVAWDAFYNDFRFRLVASQTPTGAFEPLEDEGGAFSDPASATAAGALLLALQAERVPVMLAKAENPLAARFNSEGKPVSGQAAPAGPAAKGAEGAPAEVMKLLEGLGAKPVPGGKK